MKLIIHLNKKVLNEGKINQLMRELLPHDLELIVTNKEKEILPDFIRTKLDKDGKITKRECMKTLIHLTLIKNE